MKVLPMQQIRAFTPEEFRNLVKEGCAIERRALKATDAHKMSFTAMGKLVCRAEEDMNLLKADRDEKGQPKKRQLPANTNLAEYWRMYVVQDKDAKLNPHWLSCAVTFGTYVRMDLVTETDYDDNTAECLELAASIATKCGYDISHESVVAAAAELKRRSNAKGPSNSRNKLKAILDGLKPETAMTAEKAKELITQILNANPSFLPDIVIPAVGAEIAHITDMEIAKSVNFALDTAVSMFGQNVNETGQPRFPEDVIASWYSAKAEANAPVQILRAGQPAAPEAAAA